MRDEQLKQIERELARAMCGELPLSSVADFSTRSLGAALAEIRRLQRENAGLRGVRQKAA
jgi:hypothetical protein